MPHGARSTATARVNVSMAPFTESYAIRFRCTRLAPLLLMLTMLPRTPRRAMMRAAWCVQ